MKTYNDNGLMEKNNTLRFPSFKNRNGVQKIVTSMPDDHTIGQSELNTLDDMRWNENQQRPINYRSRDSIKSIRWLMPQPAYAEHLIYAPWRFFNSDVATKRLYTEMHTADGWWETQVRRTTQG